MKLPRTHKLIIAAFLVLITSIPAFAHKVRIFAWEDSGTIVTESKFSGGRPAKNAKVAIIDTANGQQLLSGTTDTDGFFTFPVPAVDSAIEIVVDGGDGHKNSWLFNMEETKKSVTDTPHIHPTNPAPQKQQALGMTGEELRQIVEEAMDKKLVPIKRMFAESTDQGPTLQDILGGIGYILGLAGIAAYFQSRKKDKE